MSLRKKIGVTIFCLAFLFTSLAYCFYSGSVPSETENWGQIKVPDVRISFSYEDLYSTDKLELFDPEGIYFMSFQNTRESILARRLLDQEWRHKNNRRLAWHKMDDAFGDIHVIEGTGNTRYDIWVLWWNHHGEEYYYYCDAEFTIFRVPDSGLTPEDKTRIFEAFWCVSEMHIYNTSTGDHTPIMTREMNCH